MMTFILWVIIILLLASLLKKNVVMGPPMKLLDEEFDISKEEHQEYARYVIELMNTGINHRSIPNFREYHEGSAGQFLFKNFDHPIVQKIKEEVDQQKKRKALVDSILKELEDEDKKKQEAQLIEDAREEAKRIFESKKNS